MTTWKEIALRGLAEKRKNNLLEFTIPANWKYRPRYFKSAAKVLSISIKDTTMHYEGDTLIVETGSLAPDPEPPTPPRAA
jgi:hypothetical protein